MSFNKTFSMVLFGLTLSTSVFAENSLDQCLDGNLDFATTENVSKGMPSDGQYYRATYQLDFNTNQLIINEGGLVKTKPFGLLKIEVAQPSTSDDSVLVLGGKSVKYAWRENYQLNFTITQVKDYVYDLATGIIKKDLDGKWMTDNYLEPEVIVSSQLFSCFGVKSRPASYRTTGIVQ